jgi:tight adherence protein B
VNAAVLLGGVIVLIGWLGSAAIASGGHNRTLVSLGAQVSPPPSWSERLGLVRRWLSASRPRLLLLLAAIAGGVLGNRVMGPVGFLAGSIAAVLVMRGRERRASIARRDLLDRQLVDAVMAVSAAVRAGLSVRRAVEEATGESEEPLRSELESVVDRLAMGETLDASLEQLDRRLGLTDAALLVSALRVHRRTGGDLPVLLDEIAAVTRARLDDRRGVRALTAQARTSGAVLAVLPIGFVALLSGTGGDGLGDFYRSSAGVALLLFSLCLQGLGFAWMRLIVQRVESW